MPGSAPAATTYLPGRYQAPFALTANATGYFYLRQQMDKSMMSGMQPDAEQSQAGYKICIKVDDQGAITVGVDAHDAEMGEMGEMGGIPEDDAGGGYAPAQSIDEALQVARDIYNNNGQVRDAMSPEDSLMKGYNEGGKKPMRGGMSPAKVFGDE